MQNWVHGITISAGIELKSCWNCISPEGNCCGQCKCRTIGVNDPCKIFKHGRSTRSPNTGSKDDANKIAVLTRCSTTSLDADDDAAALIAGNFGVPFLSLIVQVVFGEICVYMRHHMSYVYGACLRRYDGLWRFKRVPLPILRKDHREG